MDVAIIPVVDYFQNCDLEMVDGLGICADGNVESVILQCNKQLKEVRTVKFDPDSKTSNLLLKVLAGEEFLGTPNMICNREMENPDARVIIGDRALCATPSIETYDLAGQWKNMTGLPFVFAVWVYRAGHPDAPKLRRMLHTAKRLGCGAIGMLARIYAQQLNLSEKRCYHYLTQCIHYDIGDSELAAMERFRNLLQGLHRHSPQSIRTINGQNTKEIIDDNLQHQSI